LKSLSARKKREGKKEEDEESRWCGRGCITQPQAQCLMVHLVFKIGFHGRAVLFLLKIKKTMNVGLKANTLKQSLQALAENTFQTFKLGMGRKRRGRLREGVESHVD
jgi:hypothetical protein